MARPSVQVSIQTLNETVYLKHRFFVIPDPAFDIGANTSFLLEAKVNSISLGLNEEIGVAELEYPNRSFGSHIGFVSPITIVLDNADNVVFRGFLNVETGIVSTDEDILKVKAYDYKWLLGKTSKIRGKIYTGDNFVKPIPGGLAGLRTFGDRSLFEKYRYRIADSIIRRFNRSDVTGYIGSQKTCFNENEVPNCASKNLHANFAVAFKADQDPYYANNLQWNRITGDERFYWTYATILEYIARYYVENMYEGFFNTTRMYMNRSGLSKIERYGDIHGEELITPIDFDITGLSPCEAIDKVVKEIPGSWFWRMLYYKDSIIIDVDNNTDSVLINPGKTLFLGSGGKLTNQTSNDANVKSASVERSVVDSISHAVAVGAGLEIETSVEYIPGWEQYLRPESDLTVLPDQYDDHWTLYDGNFVPSGFRVSNFKNPADYNLWLEFVHRMFKTKDATTSGKIQEVLTTEDEIRYAKIFRIFVFPTYKWDIVQWPDVSLEQFGLYRGFATQLHELIFPHVIIPRKIKGPITNYRPENPLKGQLISDDTIENTSKKNRSRVREQSPFVFLYDPLLSQTLIDDVPESLSADFYDELMERKRFIIPDDNCEKDDKNDGLNYSFEYENRLIIFDNPQYQRKTVSYQNQDKTVLPRFIENIDYRKVFVTCRIVCDVPIIEDRIRNRSFYGNARLVSQDIDENKIAVIRVNAFYPTPPGEIGSSLVYNDAVDTRTGSVSKIPAGSDVDSRLVDWNDIDENFADSVLIVSDIDRLKQALEVMIGDVPLYSENIDVDLGRIDMNYLIGDRINRILNSDLEDGTGGYYGLRALINKITYSKIGDSDSFSCQMTMNNYYVPTKLNMTERK